MTRETLRAARADAIRRALRDLEADSDGRFMNRLLDHLDGLDAQFAPVAELGAAVTGQKMDTVPVSTPANPPARRTTARMRTG